jgi:hypothetical protein
VSKLRPADYVAGIGGLVLLVSLWLPWYGFDAKGLLQSDTAPGWVSAVPAAISQFTGSSAFTSARDGGVIDVLDTFSTHVPEASAWQAFSILDIVLFLIALVVIGIPITAATTTSPAKPVAFTILGTVFSALAVLLILYRIVNQPGSNAIIAVKPGAWIGLAGALIALIGSYLAMADEHTPGATPPDIPIRPAP